LTQLGPDLASFQTGISLSSLPDASFVFAKCTEGGSYVDPPYARWLSQADQCGKLFVWYHFLTQSDSAQAQAANTAAHVVDPTLPGMVDVETEGSSTPTLREVCAYIDACRALGLRIKLAYLPQWYWAQVLGSPDLSPLTRRGVGLVSSGYPGASAAAGGPSQYQSDGGDHGVGWAAYGGVTPIIWQFTDQAAEGGKSIDYNAYRGSLAELTAFLAEPGHAAAPPAAVGSRVLVQGDTGADVRAMQHELIAHAYCVAEDGDFGAVTDTRVRQFQHDHGLVVDGCIGGRTAAALAQTPRTIPFPGSAAVRLGASGAAVTILQKGLIRCGFAPSGGADGDYGSQTNTQVGAFQEARGLTRDYVVGPVTWAQATTV
jgi:lysozyme